MLDRDDKQYNSGITIPCHWDESTILEIVKNNIIQNGIVCKEVYGVLASDGPVGHGRTSQSVPYVTRQEAVKFRKFIHECGLNFSYLLNAPFEFTDNEQCRQLDQYLDWILYEFKPNALTITSHDLMRYVRKRDSDISIHVSTIAGIKSGEELKKFFDISPSRVVPHHDCGKRWKDLREIVEVGRKNGVEVEILSTESCLLNCPNRNAHYRHIGNKSSDSEFHTTCNSTKLIQPREILMAGGIIRPEDLRIFEEMGVKYFKISGRSKPAQWLPEVVKAYIDREYNGNLVRLFGIDPELHAEEWIYLDNKSLNGFLENYPQNGDRLEEERYCDMWMIRLYRKGAFQLKDGTEYQAENDMLKIKKMGKNSKTIITKEGGRV